MNLTTGRQPYGLRLLGRAKRVLNITKAEERIKDIIQGMAVSEHWLANLDPSEQIIVKIKKEKQDMDEDSDSSSEEMEDKKSKKKKGSAGNFFFPGLGYKDKATAERTLTELEGRDPNYQKWVIKGLVQRSKSVLRSAQDETKQANLKEAIATFNQFLDDFDTKHMSEQNNAYVRLRFVRTAEKLSGDSVTEKQRAFIAAYSSVNGEYKHLRTVPEKEGGKTWDIVRNAALKHLKEKHANAKLFNEKDEPTPEHLELLLWAYSPEAAKVKRVVAKTKEDRKRKSSGGDETLIKIEKEEFL